MKTSFTLHQHPKFSDSQHRWAPSWLVLLIQGLSTLIMRLNHLGSFRFAFWSIWIRIYEGEAKHKYLLKDFQVILLGSPGGNHWKRNYSWPLNHAGCGGERVGAVTLCAVENQHIIYSQPSLSMVPLYQPFCIQGFHKPWGRLSWSICYWKKSAHKWTRTVQTVSFKGQLYFKKKK